MNAGDWKATSELSETEIEILEALEFEPEPESAELDGPVVDLCDPDGRVGPAAQVELTDHDERILRRVERFTAVWACVSVVVGLAGTVIFAAVSPAMSFASLVVAAGGAGFLLSRRRTGERP